MANQKNIAFAKTAETIIKNLAKGQIEGFYFPDSKSCVNCILSLLPDDCTISWGGSESLVECGLLDSLNHGKYKLLDRNTAKTPDEARQLYSEIVMSDYYFMSSNAITINGELINIDGYGNRLACLMQGPKNVFLIVGMNKIVTDIECGYKRVKNISAPANVQRLNRKTPCHETGRCENCFSPDCVCSHTVITRRCSQKNRIKVFLVGEELGY